MFIEILRGADAPIQFTLKDCSTNQPIDINTLTGVIIVLYYQDDRGVLGKYSREVKPGYSTLDVIDAAQGIVEVKLQSTTTQTARLGKVLAEIKTQAAVSPGYVDGNFHTATGDIEVIEIVDALSKNETDLTV